MRRARVVKIAAWASLGVALLAVGAVGGVYALLRVNEAHAPVVPTAYVPVRFRSLRDTPGHLVHVREQKLACTECHDVAKDGFKIPDDSLCTSRCHVDQHPTIHEGTLVASAALECQSCHSFNEDRNLQPKNCVRCHDRTQGFTNAVVQHAKLDCTTCHRPHASPSLAPKACTDCHQKEQTTHAGSADATLTCLDCHRMHDDQHAADRRCRDCHGAAGGRIAVPATATFGGGHTTCVSCHVPHRFAKSDVKACVSCHQDQPVLASAKVKQHATCLSCHTPHDASRASARARCVTCHADVHPSHPADPKGGTCLGCHPIHDRQIPFLAAASPPARSCASCHPNSRSKMEQPFHSAKLTCGDCHKAHAFALNVKDPTLCAGCHKDEVAKAKSNAGHSACLSCHPKASHDPTADRPTCATCHRVEELTAPAGHSSCGNCHETHSGALRAKATTCVSCHDDKPKRLHGVGVPGGCQSCHRPHGPNGPAQPPSCTTCHEAKKLPSLHQVPQHQECAKCHTPHDRPKPDRATCAQCHTTGGADKKPLAQHEPGAASCAGCHPFR
jgi:predicted CXXCH cytochrome family protein